MTPFFQTGPEGTTIHLPPFPNGLGALLWLIGFGVALVLLLGALHIGPRIWTRLNAPPEEPGGFGVWLGWPRKLDSRLAPGLGRILGVLLPIGIAVPVLWLLVDFFIALATPDTQDDLRNIGLTLAGLIGFPLLIWRSVIAQQQARTAQENLVTGLINKAVEGLGAEKTVKEKGKEQTHPNIEVRIGAILQLERIAHTQAHSGTDQGARDHIRIMEILCAYIRENAPAAKAVDLNMGEWPEYPQNPTAEELEARAVWRRARAEDLRQKIDQIRTSHRPRTDIQTTLTVIGRRDATQVRIEQRAIRPGQEDGYRLDLRAARLQAADLSHLDLDRANLREARLEGAYLAQTGLNEANLEAARLEGADLSAARLKGANLHWTRAEGAYLGVAQLESAHLREARLQGADLREARVKRAYFRQARLEGACLWKARLEGADLQWADLGSATWAGPKEDANPVLFSDLRGITAFDQFSLSSMVGNAATLLPDDPPGLFIPHKWATEPPGFDRLLDMLAGPGRYRHEVRAQLICGPTEVPMKTGTPWPLDAPPPWDAAPWNGDRHRWTAAHPPTEPVD